MWYRGNEQYKAGRQFEASQKRSIPESKAMQKALVLLERFLCQWYCLVEINCNWSRIQICRPKSHNKRQYSSFPLGATLLAESWCKQATFFPEPIFTSIPKTYRRKSQKSCQKYSKKRQLIFSCETGILGLSTLQMLVYWCNVCIFFCTFLSILIFSTPGCKWLYSVI